MGDLLALRHPDVPSVGWDASTYRTATWALFTHYKSGRKFFYVNTHIDHVGQVAARSRWS